MEERLKLDFEKTLKNLNFSKKEIETKQNYLSRFLKVGLPNRSLENWKFSDLSQIIKKNIGELSFYNDYSSSNKVDSSIFVDGLEHNKIVFINGRVEKIDFQYEEKSKIEILEETETITLMLSCTRISLDRDLSKVCFSKSSSSKLANAP